MDRFSIRGSQTNWREKEIYKNGRRVASMKFEHGLWRLYIPGKPSKTLRGHLEQAYFEAKKILSTG